MINLFIDSNIWLSLYHFTSDDLTQFGRIMDLIGKSIKLYIPQQVFDEVLRNREAKLKDAFISFDIKTLKFPAFCKEYEEYAQLYKDYSSVQQKFSLWKKKIDEDVKKMDLPADRTIRNFFNSVELLSCDKYIDKAFSRYKIGNPPGKDNKYGDAINWECLLDKVPNGEDLYFISADKDYRSDIVDGAFNPFLTNEWGRKKNSKIHFYRGLVDFLNENIEDIKLSSEEEKNKLITDLDNSRSFMETHGIIAMLNKYTGWTEDQIEQLCNAVINNSQVGMIIYDRDLFEFYASLLSKLDYNALPENSIKQLWKRLLPPEEVIE